MAIADIYNSLTFGGVNSLDYGIYITGPAVFDAPTRDIEFISVPGRNGAIEIDKGHWNNIEVTYHAGVFGDNQSDFASKINAFRNAIVSQIGYQRLTDTYNPNEYRLGLYASGLTVSAVNTNKAGEFDLVFNCKPQRYLLSGENEITVASGDVIVNPTSYSSGPLLEVNGHGTIYINESALTVQNLPVGEIPLLGGGATQGINGINNFKIVLPRDIDDYINTGDVVSINGLVFGVSVVCYEGQIFSSIPTPTIVQDDKYRATVAIHETAPTTTMTWRLAKLGGVKFEYNPGGDSIVVGGVEGKILGVGVKEGSLNASENVTMRLEATYEPGANAIRFRFMGLSETLPGSEFGPMSTWGEDDSIFFEFESVSGISSKPGTTNAFIDLDSGQAYVKMNDTIVDINKNVIMQSDLARLNLGANAVRYDETIASLKIKPRWWKL